MSEPVGGRGTGNGRGVTIVLFDIDGTLLTTAGAARAAFARGLTEAAGRPINPDGYSFSGRTDPQIARDILSSHGLSEAELGTAIPESIRLYRKRRRRPLPAAGPGARAGAPARRSGGGGRPARRRGRQRS